MILVMTTVLVLSLFNYSSGGGTSISNMMSTPSGFSALSRTGMARGPGVHGRDRGMGKVYCTVALRRFACGCGRVLGRTNGLSVVGPGN